MNPSRPDSNTPLTARDVIEQQSCNRSRCECHATLRKGKGLTHCPAHDNPGASLSVKQDGDRLLWHCFAGCSQGAVQAALGIAPHPVYTAPVAPRTYSNGTASGPVVSVYEYTDRATGKPIRKNRHEPKTFIWESQDAAGRWIYGRNGLTPGLYHQEAVLGAPAGAVVFFAGGEKGTDALCDRGEIATCNPDGDASWEPCFAESFRDKVVIALPDNDPAGHQLAQRLVSDLAGIARRVYVVNLPGLDEHQDVYDYLEHGGTVEQIVRLALCSGPSEVSPVVDSGRCDELQAENDDLRATLRGISAVQSNKVLSPGTRCTTIALSKHLAAAPWDGKQRDRGEIHVSLKQVAASAGVSSQAASGHLSVLAAGGLIARTVTRVPNPEGDGYKSELLIRPLAGGGVVNFLQAVGSFKPVDAPMRGGWRDRRCPNGCDADLVKRTTLVCTGCGAVVDQAEEIASATAEPKILKSTFGSSEAEGGPWPLRTLTSQNLISLHHAGADSLKHQNGSSAAHGLKHQNGTSPGQPIRRCERDHPIRAGQPCPECDPAAYTYAAGRR